MGRCRTAKNEFGLETYIGSSQGQEAVRCRFRIGSGTAGLFADKKRCGLCGDDICVMCDREEVENVLHSARRPPLVSESGLNNFSLLEIHLVPLLVFFPLYTNPVVLLARL